MAMPTTLRDSLTVWVPSILLSPVSLETELVLVYLAYMKLRLLTGRLVKVDLADSPNFTRHIDRIAQSRTGNSVEVNLWMLS